MLKNSSPEYLSRRRLIAMWFAAVAMMVAASLVGGMTATPGTWTMLLLISLAPPALAFVVWRGAPPPTVAEVLYAVRQPDDRR